MVSLCIMSNSAEKRAAVISTHFTMTLETHLASVCEQLTSIADVQNLFKKLRREMLLHVSCSDLKSSRKELRGRDCNTSNLNALSLGAFSCHCMHERQC